MSKPAGGPVRRPMVGAAAAKAAKAEESKSTKEPSRGGRAPSAPKSRPSTSIKRGPLKGVSNKPEEAAEEKPAASKARRPSQLEEEDSRGVRRSADEYMSSASQRMQALSMGLKKKNGGKTGLEDYEMGDEAAAEAADSAAMSMLDLLASLESSGQTELGIFSSSILQYSKVRAQPSRQTTLGPPPPPLKPTSSKPRGRKSTTPPSLSL